MTDNNIYGVFNKWFEETKFGKTPDEGTTTELLKLLESQKIGDDVDRAIHDMMVDTLAIFYTEELPRRMRNNG